MTNPAGPMGTPPRGGMPKWLIIALVVLLVVILGCCGGITACFFGVIHVGNKVAREGVPRLQQMAQEAQQQAEAAARERAAGAAGGAAPTGDNGAPAGDNGTPAAGETAAAGASNARAQKLPSNFPSDVPVEPGMTPTFTIGDNTKGSGSVILSGNVKPDDAVAYYTKELEKAGWTQTGNTAINTTTQMQYKKDPLTMVVQVSGGEGNEGTTVMISYEKQQ